MKYLHNRDQFINKSLNKINEYKELENHPLYKEYLITEAESGPFANDIPWGDSLLGRLINSVIRKAKIGANLVRIKGVTRRLRDAFDALMGQSVANELSEEEKKEFSKLQIFIFLDALDKAIKEGRKVGIIKGLTDDAIKQLKFVVEYVNESEIFTGKDTLKKLMAELEEFRKFLNQFKDDEGEDDPSISEEGDEEGEEGEEGEGEEGEGDSSTSGSKSSESLYPTMIKNLKALAIITDAYKRVKIETAKGKEQSTQTTKRTYKTLPGDTVDKIVAKTDVNVKKLTADVLRQKNTEVLKAFPKNNQTLKPGLILVMESVQFINEALPGGSPERGNIKGGEDHLTQAFTKLKKDIEVLISSKEKGVGIDTNFINAITSKAVDTNTKNLIKSLYTEVNRYLVGDKKGTLQDKDPLYKESLEIIADKNKRVIAAEKIARFTKRALQFDKEGLYGGLGDLSKPLKDFVDSIKEIMQMSPAEPKKEEPKKEESKKESRLARYSEFRLIREAEGDEEDEDRKVSDPRQNTTSQKIKDYWEKKVDIKEFVMDATEVTKIKTNFDTAAKKKQDSIIINGIDPILEIVKVFNRAYKIHTTQVIPSGRSGGKVSNSVFMEYTCFGTGSPENAGSGGGPYRNNAIFNQWENAVLDIMGEPKYQPIFNVETKINMGGKMIEKAGANLAKFMRNMLDAEDLYKGDSGKEGGAQARFLKEYFGYDEKDPNKISEQISYSDDLKVNAENAAGTNSKKLDFTAVNIPFGDPKELSKTFIAINADRDGTNRQFFGFIQSVDSEYLYITYCGTFYFYKQYILQTGHTFAENIKGEFPFTPEMDRTADSRGGEKREEYRIKGFRVKINEFITDKGEFRVKRVAIRHISKFENGKNKPDAPATLIAEDKDESFLIKGIYTLCDMTSDKVSTGKDKKRFKIEKDSKVINEKIKAIGGIPNITGVPEISKTYLKKE